jgi:hypothetical protein
MTCDGPARPQNEVDEVRWVGVDEALSLLSYDRDVEVLDELLRRRGAAV